MAFLCLDKNSLLESPSEGLSLSIHVSVEIPDKIYDDIHFEYLNFEAFIIYAHHPNNSFPDLNRKQLLWGFQILFEVDSKTNNINKAVISSRYTHGISIMWIRGLIDSNPEDANKNFGLALNEIREFIVQQYIDRIGQR